MRPSFHFTLTQKFLFPLVAGWLLLQLIVIAAIVNLDTSRLSEEQWKKGFQLAEVMIVISVVGALFLWLLLKKFVLRPSNAMTDAIILRNEGNRSARAVVYGDDEMAWLTSALNAMFDDLEEEENERVKAEGKLRRMTVFQQALLNSAGVSIIATDIHGVIKTFNHNAETLLGYTADELINFATPATFHDIKEVVLRAQQLSYELGRTIEPGFEVFVVTTRERNCPDTREWTYLNKNGNRIPVRLTVSCVRDDAGELNGYIGIAQDITEQKRVEAELRSLTMAAQNATQAKSEFLAVMSHEIRTPMNGVIGMSRLLEKTPLNDKQQGLVNSINHSGEVLMSIINDVLDFSKIDADKMVLESAPFSAHNLFDQTVRLYEAEARKKNIGFRLVYLSHDCLLRGDQFRLAQIVNNLISNAIKFTECGEVCLTVNTLSDSEGEVMLEFSVKDSGIGMSGLQQKKIFQPFMQADSSTTRQYGGTGLGLVICKRLVELMNGQLDIHSEIGVGTEFIVKIPLLIAQIQTPIKTKTQIKTGPFTILLVDDVEINRDVAAGILESSGHQIILACNGIEAFLAYRQHYKKIDIILMDCLMPELDGYGAAKKIREWEKDRGKRTPIIALTASALAETRKKCLDAGMDDFVSKPFDEIELLEKIGGLVCLSETPFEKALADELKIQKEQPNGITDNKMPSAVVNHQVLDDLFKRFGPDKGKMLLQKFIESMDEFSLNLKNAFIKGDNLTMHRMAHNLKSSCGNVGAVNACSIAADLENLIHESEAAFENSQYIELLINEISVARQEIAAHRSFS